MSSKTIKLLFSSLSVVLIAAGGWYLLRESEAPLPPSYGATELRQGEIRAVVSATGTLNPVDTVQVGSQVSGTIDRLFADFNDAVGVGQVVAQIDPAIFKAKLAEAEANLAKAKAEREKAKVRVEEARREHERQQGLFRKNLTAESLLDAARFALDAARVDHVVAEAAVSQAQSARDREQVNLTYTTIRAPIDGVVISRDVDVGQTVAASLQAPTLFTIARDLTRMQVEADVDEAFIGEVAEGQKAQFTVFAYAGRSFEGTVAQVRLNPKVEAGVVKYNCIIRVDNADLALKPGMTATVSIEVARRDGAMQVPNSALRFVPDWPEQRLNQVRGGLSPGEAVIWTSENGNLVPITVTTGIVGEQMVEIRGQGLRPGMPILIPEKRKQGEARRRFGLSLF